MSLIKEEAISTRFSSVCTGHPRISKEVFRNVNELSVHPVGWLSASVSTLQMKKQRHRRPCSHCVTQWHFILGEATSCSQMTNLDFIWHLVSVILHRAEAVQGFWSHYLTTRWHSPFSPFLQGSAKGETKSPSHPRLWNCWCVGWLFLLMRWAVPESGQHQSRKWRQPGAECKAAFVEPKTVPRTCYYWVKYTQNSKPY